jgi:hypothetical protein
VQAQATPVQQQPPPSVPTQPAVLAPVPRANNGNQNPPASQPTNQVSPLATAPKGPAGSIYNSAPPVPRSAAKPSTSTAEAPFHNTANESKPEYAQGPPPHRPESPRGRPTSPRRQEPPHRYSNSPTYHRGPPPPTSTNYSRDSYPRRYSDDLPPTREPPRPAMATRVTTPPSRVSYRDRSRSPHQRMSSLDHRPHRPIIPEEGYRRDNWDPNRGGYKLTASPPPSHRLDRYSPPIPRRVSPPPPPPSQYPRRDVDEMYYRNMDGPPLSRDSYDDYHRNVPPPAMIRTRSRSPPYRPVYQSPPPIPPRDFPPPPPQGRGGYYDYPTPRDTYPPSREVSYHSPLPPAYRERRAYDDYYSASLPPPLPVEYPEREYERGYPRGATMPPPSSAVDIYEGGYRDYRDSREREMVKPPPGPPVRSYTPPAPPQRPPRSRGKNRGRRGRY